MSAKIFNPLMDPENNDLEKVVKRYNKMISFSDNKKYEWEYDDYIEYNYGWEKIKSVDDIHDRLIETANYSLRRFGNKLVPRVDGTRRWIYPRLDDRKCPELFEAIKDLSTHNFLNEIMINCERITTGANPPIFNKKTIDTTCCEFFNSKSEILDFLRRKRKTHHIFFRTIKMDRFDESEFNKPSGYTKDNYCLILYVCER